MAGEDEAAGKDYAVMELGVRRCSASRSPGDPGYLLISNLSSG